MERLRRRAYDPAMRLDQAYVPREWLRREYGDETVRRITQWIHQGDYPWQAVLEEGDPWETVPRSDDPWETVPEADGRWEAVMKAGAAEAVEFFKDAAHEPPYPPVAVSELMAAEERMGRRLPDPLRRLYTEVANGGFGPMNGILGITQTGQRDGYGNTAVEEYLANPELNEPLGFPLIAAGCNVWWYVSLTKPGNPVYLFDRDAWDWPDQDPPEVAVHHTAPDLAEWLGRWADGHDVWPHDS